MLRGIVFIPPQILYQTSQFNSFRWPQHPMVVLCHIKYVVNWVNSPLGRRGLQLARPCDATQIPSSTTRRPCTTGYRAEDCPLPCNSASLARGGEPSRPVDVRLFLAPRRLQIKVQRRLNFYLLSRRAPFHCPSEAMSDRPRRRTDIMRFNIKLRRYSRENQVQVKWMMWSSEKEQPRTKNLKLIPIVPDQIAQTVRKTQRSNPFVTATFAALVHSLSPRRRFSHPRMATISIKQV